MKMKLFALLLLAGDSLFAIGVPYYAPPPPPPVVVYSPPCPGPEYTWVPGYYYPVGARFVWLAGFWSRPQYAGAYRVAPRYYEHRYYPGYWERWSAGSTMIAGYTAVGTGTTMTTNSDRRRDVLRWPVARLQQSQSDERPHSIEATIRRLPASWRPAAIYHHVTRHIGLYFLNAMKFPPGSRRRPFTPFEHGSSAPTGQPQGSSREENHSTFSR
jgi:hypothetical protein